MRSVVAGSLLLFLLLTANAQITVSKDDAGPISAELTRGFPVNQKSTLQRTAYMLNDPSCPIKLSTLKISPGYEERAYFFAPNGVFVPKEPIAALEIRILLFDVFGSWMKTLSFVRIEDDETVAIPIGGVKWFADANAVTDYATSVSFVARVRKTSGAQWTFNSPPTLKAISGIEASISAEDLNPNPKK